jgi:membrane-associated protein
VYLIVVVAAVIENIFPPAPADVVITVAAFLSHRGTTNATTVFWLTWVANVGGATLVYLLARRLGPRFVESRVGRRLISPEAVVAIERNYLRFGLAGLVIARLLPGFRSFTAPFAGIMRLGVVRSLIPIALASGGWYGTLVFLAARLGRNWAAVEKLVSGLNRTLAVVALVAAALGGIWLLRRRKRSRRDEMQTEIVEELKAYPQLGQRALENPAVAAVAALLLETASRDQSLSVEELEAIESHLRARWHLAPGAGLDPAVAQQVVQRLEPAARTDLIARLREMAFGDGALQRHETHVMQRVARLLGMSQ